MAGGYLTGRMRRRFNDATEHESDVRDGAHGLLVWAGALVIGAIIAVGGIGAAVSAVGNAIGTATMAASNVADDAAGTVDPNAYFVDTLFRPPPGATPAAGSLQDFRGEATRILANGALPVTVSETDKAYLAQIVSANTGLTPDEANGPRQRSADGGRYRPRPRRPKLPRKPASGPCSARSSRLLRCSSAPSAPTGRRMKGGNHRDKQTVFAGFGRF